MSNNKKNWKVIREKLEALDELVRGALRPVPIAEYHEDYGTVLWWTLPIEEPPYVGSPLDSDWPDHHTHFTRLICPEVEGERSQ